MKIDLALPHLLFLSDEPARRKVTAQIQVPACAKAAQELPLPPPSLCQASEDKSGRGLPAEVLAKAGAG